MNIPMSAKRYIRWFATAVIALFSNRIWADVYKDMYVTSSWLVVQTRDAADEVLRLNSEGVPFARLAASLSGDPGSSSSGGFLGVSMCSSYIPKVSELLCNAEIGKIVGPIQTQFGWSLHMVHARSESAFDFPSDNRTSTFGPLVATLILSCDMRIPSLSSVPVKIDLDQSMATLNGMRAFVQPTDTQLRLVTSNGMRFLIDRTTGVATAFGSKSEPLLFQGQCRSSAQRLF